MARVLVTGMSGTGKSTVLARLAVRGHLTVDADEEGWSQELTAADGQREQLWRADWMDTLLAGDRRGHLFIGGCASNQGSFYDRLDAVVLLSVPVDVLLRRLASRATNDFGKDPEERGRILRDLAEVEPLLRATATIELDTRRPLDEIVDAIEAIAASCRAHRHAPKRSEDGGRSSAGASQYVAERSIRDGSGAG